MDKRTITVSGTGTATAKPDRVRIEMTLTDRCPGYDETLETMGRSLAALRESLNSVGICREEIKTQRFNVSPRYKKNRYTEDGELLGYEGTHKLSMEIPMESPRLSRTLSALVDCRAKPVFELYYTVGDQESLKQHVLESAVRNAADRARWLAKAADVELGEILSINYSWTEMRFERIISQNLSMACQQEQALDIEPDDINAKDTVTVVWEIIP